MTASLTMLPQLDLDLCRARQERLRSFFALRGVERALLVRPEHVQYLTGYRPHPLQRAAVLLDGERCLLVAPNQEPDRHAADVVRCFEAQWLCTLRQDQEQAMAAVLAEFAQNRAPLGLETSCSSPALLSALGVCDLSLGVDLEPDLLRLRRRKDADELAMLRHAIAASEAMYARARAIIRPGIRELTVFNELQSAAVEALGEPLTATGNDYQCASPGGSPRDRAAQAGELFILDLGPAYRGYFADNCRTFAVDGRPDAAQQEAQAVIVAVLDEIARRVRPGVSCREVFAAAKARLDAHLPGAFFHHLGHGIGLYPHEAPHLNPAWDEVFEEGDVFTAEPGLYHESLRAGIRIEEDYRVTADGVEKLTSFPLDL